MPYYRFGRDDKFINRIKAHPKSNFLIYSGSVFYNNIPNESGSFTGSVGGVPIGHKNLYELNVDRSLKHHHLNSTFEAPSNTPADALGKFNMVSGSMIVPYLLKKGDMMTFKTVSTGAVNALDWGEQIPFDNFMYPLSASIHRNFFPRDYTGRTKYTISNVSFYNFILDKHVILDPRPGVAGYLKASSSYVQALQTTLDYYTPLSPHYAFTSSYGDKMQQAINLISIPSIFYGTSINKGSVDLGFYISGSLVARCRDERKNGELIQVEPVGSIGSGSVAGVVLYNEGFVMLTGSWDLSPSSSVKNSFGAGYGENYLGENVGYLYLDSLRFDPTDVSLTPMIIQLDNTGTTPKNSLDNLEIIQAFNEKSHMSSGGEFDISKADKAIVKFTGIPDNNDRITIQDADGVVGSYIFADTDNAGSEGATTKYIRRANRSLPEVLVELQKDINAIKANVEITASVEHGGTPKWVHWGGGINNKHLSLHSSSFSFDFEGTQYTPVKTMLAHTPRGYFNHSNNPTYPQSNVTGSTQVLAASGPFAVATFKFGNTEFDDVNNGTIKLLSTDGTEVTYTIKNDDSADVTQNQFEGETDASTTAENFKAAVEHPNGHNGKLKVLVNDDAITKTAVGASGKVLVKQTKAGPAGNTEITTAASFDSTTDTNAPSFFNGGEDQVYYEYDANNRLSGSLIGTDKSETYYIQNDGHLIKNIFSSSYSAHSGSFKKQTYISKIGLYDENRVLIGIAKLATPVKKTENREFTFKLKLDI